MKAKLLLVAIIAVASCGTSAEDVLEWTDADFAQEIQRHENTLVMFYAPW
jgi:thioredoxin-like negative regulator of GroEL